MLKTIVAFGAGLGVLVLVQHFWVAAVTARIATAPPIPMTQIDLMPGFKFDGDKLGQAINPPVPKFDITAGQGLAVESAIRQADIQRRNALSNVPVQRSYPGMPR